MDPKNKLGAMPVRPLLYTMAVPLMLSLLIQSLYNIVDSIFVARLSETALTAASLVYAIQFLMIAIGVGTAVGLNALLSRKLGQKKPEEACRAATTGLFLMLGTSLVFTLVGLLFSNQIAAALTNDPELQQLCREYLSVNLVFCWGIFLQTYGQRLLQAVGDTVLSMISLIIGAVVNIILDPIMIFGLLGCPAMGIAGAAIATVIGQIGGMTLGLVLNQAKNVELRLHLKGFRPNKTILKGILDVGFPSIIMQSISSVMNVLMNMILLGFGAMAVNVLGVYFKLQSFVFMPVFGLSNGLVAILGYNYGARMRARVYDALKVALIWACVIMLLGTIAFLLIPETLLSLFEAGDARDLTDMGVVALRVISLGFLLAAVGITISTLFQAVGKGMYSLRMSLCRQIIVLLPVAWLLSKTGNVDAVWWSFPVAELFSVALCLLLYRRVDRNMLQKL